MLDDRVVLVTGAAGRIGAAIARGVVSEGGQVALVDVDAPALDELEAELSPANSLRIHADATDPGEVASCIGGVLDRFGKLDAAVHSAYPRSSGWGTPFEGLKPEFLNEDLSRHLGGAILFSQQVINHFMRQGWGNLVHVSSIQGVRAPRFEHYEGTNMVSPIEYGAIKAGLISVTQYLAKYYKGKNIRVNCISPGGITDEQPSSFLERYNADCNNKGMLDAEDLVGTATFLLSENSRYITGQNIIIDDGWSL